MGRRIEGKTMNSTVISQPMPADRFIYDPHASIEDNLRAAGYEYRGEATAGARRIIVRSSSKRVAGEMNRREAASWLMALSAARATFKHDISIAEVSRFDLLPDYCMVFDQVTGHGILIRQGEEGFYQREGTNSEYVRYFNRTHGIIPRQAEAMHIGSMFGWHVPGADPRFPAYDNLPPLF
ncbi:MAG: hypothetical protein KG075_22280 [Alphaproteobacteria bacterium]|nr:hypothetical protein [Alphaproteobacteria bacterium]